MNLTMRSARTLSKLLWDVAMPRGVVISDPDEYRNRCNRIAFLIYLALV